MIAKERNMLVQELEISKPNQLRQLLIHCDKDDLENLPLYAIRKKENNIWTLWILDYSNGIRYADSDEINQSCSLLTVEFRNFVKETIF